LVRRARYQFGSSGRSLGRWSAHLGCGRSGAIPQRGTVYAHASLIELITYHAAWFPDLPWRYLDLSHEEWPSLRASIAADPPDVVALTVYTATALWAFVVAAEVRRANPAATVVFSNDHAGTLYREILEGRYGRRLVDFVSPRPPAPTRRSRLWSSRLAS
jgi:hypothetical protein